MLFLAHEYVIRQAVKQVEGIDTNTISTMVLGVYFPDIYQLPITHFYKKETHKLSSEAYSIQHTPIAKIFDLGWKLHIKADVVWHNEIHVPLEGAICVNSGKFDVLRRKRMVIREHVMREIALDLYIKEHTDQFEWGTIEKLTLNDLFNGKNISSEFGLWWYKQIAKYYLHGLPIVNRLIHRGVFRTIFENYKIIEKISPIVDMMLSKSIAVTVDILKQDLEAQRSSSQKNNH